MNLYTGILVYVMIWWVVLFAVLPIGVRTQEEDGVVVPGTPASAPTTPRLLRVAVITTVISTVLFLLPWGIARYGLADVQTWVGRSSPK